jgi:hypothetical protein
VKKAALIIAVALLLVTGLWLIAVPEGLVSAGIISISGQKK